jgi:hypothetical protein
MVSIDEFGKQLNKSKENHHGVRIKEIKTALFYF